MDGRARIGSKGYRVGGASRMDGRHEPERIGLGWAGAARLGALGEGLLRALGGAHEALEAERPRWFLWWPVLFGAGIALYFNMSAEPGLGLALALPAAAVALRIAAGARHGLTLALGALILVTSGFAVAKLRTEWVRAPVLGRQVGPVDVTGVVEILEPRPGRGQRLTLSVTAIGDLAPEVRPGRVRVRAMQGLDGLRPGDAIRIRARLGPPSDPSMPGDYDFARAAWYQGIGAVGYALEPPERAPESASGAGMGVVGRAQAAIERLRQAIGGRVRTVLPGEDGAIASALITGERGSISEATTEAFRDSGLLHILSISGLHMVIMAGAVFLIVRVLLAAVPAVALRYPIKKWAAVAALAAAFAYLAISGSSVATIRSWLMTSIMLMAVLLDRPALALRNVALAALVILAAAPESLNDVGFQMSFAAVIALIALYEVAHPRLTRDAAEPAALGRSIWLFFAGIALSTLAASLAVAPFGAYHFHKSQQYAILANLMAIPVCNLVVMPAGLAALAAMPLGLEAGPLTVMGWGIGLMTDAARAVAALPGAVAHIPAMAPAALAFMVAGGLWLVLWRRRWRALGIAFLGLGAALAPLEPAPLLLAGREGRLVALRNEDGALAVLGGAGARFEAARWLEHDGDARTPDEASRAKGFVCDGVGCAGRLSALRIAVPRHGAALADDCRRADVLILSMPRPGWCRGPGTVIDRIAFEREGTHAFYDEGGGALRITTVEAWRGARPWSRAARRLASEAVRKPAGEAGAGTTASARDGEHGPARAPGAAGDDGDAEGRWAGREAP